MKCLKVSGVLIGILILSFNLAFAVSNQEGKIQQPNKSTKEIQFNNGIKNFDKSVNTTTCELSQPHFKGLIAQKSCSNKGGNCHTSADCCGNLMCWCGVSPNKTCRANGEKCP